MGSDQDTDGTFPRTVTHFEGRTTVEARPKRIAVLSTGQLDDLLSLGVVPTATTRADNAGLVPGYLADAFPTDKKRLAGMTDAGTRQAPTWRPSPPPSPISSSPTTPSATSTPSCRRSRPP